MKRLVFAVVVCISSQMLIGCMCSCAKKVEKINAHKITPRAHLAVTPQSRPDDWWMPRHKAVVDRVKQGNVDLIFIGDSITHGWEVEGKQVWDKYYAKRNAVNMGFGGDKTQNVLWRLENGETAGISPKLAILRIGTNGSKGDEYTASQIGEGIVAICQKLREDLPNTKILILAIFPRGEKPSPQRQKKRRGEQTCFDHR